MTKPIVHYRGHAIKAEERARLTPLDHNHHIPEQRITNGFPVTTSRVLSWDKDTGRIETMNTIYLPEETKEAA